MVLCFDIGGTSIKYGAAREENKQIIFDARWETPTDAKKLRGPGIEQKILDLIDSLRAAYTPEGVAISTAGMVDHKTGAILYANENIPEYTGRNLKLAVQNRFNLPCAVENDVNCAALGETAYGAGRGADSVLCVTVGTGIGGAIILDGAVWHGHSGSAGEIGYMPINGGMFEQQASTTALIRNVATKTGETLTGKEIFARAHAGDSVCKESIEALCAALAQGLAAGICLFNPAAIVLGGGIMAQGAYLRPLLEQQLGRFVNPFVLEKTSLCFAELGNSAGMAGAYQWFKQSALT
ncbi:ROK family protein [Agathobaculum sp. Marseille-P7918]|uniref:ROK family protein n=1 Tax=Agathobaculum sp. Marseille-P7918 TaxID=2479843 RepID=UPI000F635E21|nr:ROK family protein [Agathobaculum sp. Marseille-P7918]